MLGKHSTPELAPQSSRFFISSGPKNIQQGSARAHHLIWRSLVFSFMLLWCLIPCPSNSCPGLWWNPQRRLPNHPLQSCPLLPAAAPAPTWVTVSNAPSCSSQLGLPYFVTMCQAVYGWRVSALGLLLDHLWCRRTMTGSWETWVLNRVLPCDLEEAYPDVHSWNQKMAS